MNDFRQPARRWIVRFTAGGFSLAIALLLAEVAVRVLGLQGPSLLVKDSIVGQRYQPSFAGKQYIPEAGREVDLRFNREGFRGPDRAADPTPGTRRIAVLGDSFTAAVAVDEKDTFVSRLESQLAGDGAGGWEVFNFGVSGFSTGQALLTYREFARKYRPNLVVLCFYNGNDLSDNHSRSSTALRPYFTFGEDGALTLHPISTGRVGMARWLAEHSRLYLWQKHQCQIARDVIREMSGKIPPGFQIFNTAPDESIQEAWKITEALVAKLTEEVRADGADLLLVSIPAHEQLLRERWEKMVHTMGAQAAASFDADFPERKLSEICRRANLRFLPLVDAMRAGCKQEQLHFLAEGHWNEAGNRLAAETIHRRLDPQRIAGRSAVNPPGS